MLVGMLQMQYFIKKKPTKKQPKPQKATNNKTPTNEQNKTKPTKKRLHNFRRIIEGNQHISEV